MADTTLPHSQTVKDRDIHRRLQNLERRFNAIPTTIPAVNIFGTPEIDGYYSHSLSVMTDMIVSDCYIMAPIFEYEMTMTDAFASGAPSGLELKITMSSPEGAFIDTVVATLSATPPATFSERVDLIGFLDEDILGRFASFTFAINQVGGTGSAAAIRLERPSVLRIRDA